GCDRPWFRRSNNVVIVVILSCVRPAAMRGYTVEIGRGMIGQLQARVAELGGRAGRRSRTHCRTRGPRGLICRPRKQGRGSEGRRQAPTGEQAGIPMLDLSREKASRAAARFYL